MFDRLAERGYLVIEDSALAASQFTALVRGEWHLHTLMDREFVADPRALTRHVEQAVAFFLRQYRHPGR